VRYQSRLYYNINASNLKFATRPDLFVVKFVIEINFFVFDDQKQYLLLEIKIDLGLLQFKITVF